MPGVWPLGPVVSWPASGRRPLPTWPSSPPSRGLLGLGTFVAHRRVSSGARFPLLPPFLPFLSLFSAAGQPFSEGGCTVGSRLWARDLVGSGGLVPSYGLLKIWNLTLAWQCFPRSGYPRCTRGCARGLGPARGLSVREAVALLRPLPPGVGLLLPRGLPVPERVSEGPGASCGACPPRGSSVLACTEPSRASLSVSR